MKGYLYILYYIKTVTTGNEFLKQIIAQVFTVALVTELSERIRQVNLDPSIEY